MYEIDRTDLNILTAFAADDVALDNPTYGITIPEIMNYLKSIQLEKSRKTIYLHVSKLVSMGYINKGIVCWRADTYYITPKGQKILKGEL
jgi:hypothetical protein